MTTFTPIRRKRRYQEVAEQIELGILNGEYHDGDRLPTERDLAELYMVSRTVVREAMKLLEARGLVRIQRGSGAFVRVPDTANVVRQLSVYLHLSGEPASPLQVHEVRRHLEGAIVALAAERRTEEDLRRLSALLDRLDAADLARDQMAHLDLDFHLALARATQNPIFPLMLNQLMDLLRLQFEVTWRVYDEWPPASVVRDHAAVLDAVVARDPARAREAMAEHLDASEATLRRFLTRFESELRAPQGALLTGNSPPTTRSRDPESPSGS